MDETNREHELGRVIAAYLNALQQGEQPDRAALLAAHPALAEDLAAFFANHDQMQADAGAALGSRELHLEPTLAPSEAGAAVSIATPRNGVRTKVGYFGDYELLSEIARGGMGVVFRARQVNLDRLVALKMILAGQLAGPEDVRRFYREAEAAASLDHPGIVPVFEVGHHEGQHFFSMGLVDGPNLAQVLADGPLPPATAATIVKFVVEAIAYAHDRGVIHRDLKPANVLLARLEDQSPQRSTQAVELRPVTGRAGSGGWHQPKVTDFGLAKRLAGDDRSMTGTGQILGTPSYMSPEQASGRVTDVSPLSDVYSLGAILYAALTGHPPFQSDSQLNIVMQVLEREPVTPRQLNPRVPRDLETICLKCLEKDRRKRYASARELADELQRFLSGEPIRARQIGSVQRAWRWCRRKPALASLLGLSLLVLLALALGGPWLAVKEHDIARQQEKLRKAAESAEEDASAKRRDAEEQQKIAAAEREKARENLAGSQLLLGKIARANADQAEALLWYLQAYRNSPQKQIQRSARNLIGAWAESLERTLVHDAGVHSVAVSPDGRTLLVATFGCRSQLWDLTTGLPKFDPQSHAGDVCSTEFNADSRLAMTSDWDAAQVWDVATGKQRYKVDHEVREDTVVGPSFSPDGRTIVTRTPLEGIRLWDADTGKPRSEPLAHGDLVYRMLFSPDSKLVVSLGGWMARIWKADSGESAGEPLKDVADLAFDPTGKFLAVCGKDGKVRLREVNSGREVAELTGDDALGSVQFDASGNNLIARGANSACLWRNVAKEDRQRIVLPHGPGLFAAALNPSGTYAMTASPRLVRVWLVGRDQPLWERNSPSADVRDWGVRFDSAAFSPDGGSLLVTLHNDTVEVWNTTTGRLMAREKKVHEAVFTAGGTLAAASDLGWVRLRAVPAADPRKEPALPIFRGVRRIEALRFSPDGKHALVACEGKPPQLVNATSWEPIGEPLPHEWPVSDAAFRPDCRTLVTCSRGKSERLMGTPPGKVQFWDVASRQPIGKPIELEKAAWFPAFDATGQTVMLGHSLCDVKTHKLTSLPDDARSQERTVARLTWQMDSPLPPLVDAKTGDPARIRLPIDEGGQAVLTQDGRRLITLDRSGSARLWDAQSGEPAGPPFQPIGAARERTPDGKYALFGTLTSLRIWDPLTGRPCGESLMNEQANAYAAFSPSGDTVATLWHFTAHLWDAATGQMLGPPMMMPSNGGLDVQFSPDGRQLFIPCQGLQRYRMPRPAADESERLGLSIEVRTGLTLSESGVLQKLTQPQWLERARKLEQLGGPCDLGS